MQDDQRKGEESEFDWGAEQIGKTIGKNKRQAYHLLLNGKIQCAQKKGDQWVAHRATLRAEFGART